MSYQTIHCFPNAMNETIVQIPNICPRCSAIVYFEEAAYYQWRNKNFGFDHQSAVLLLCPHCRQISCVEFDELGNYHIYPEKREFHLDSGIESTYPRFAKIYKQALTAESFGLDELSGMGMRKAVEALIKQFAAEKSPDQKDKIEKETLKQVIDNLDIQDVQLLALANTYLGNDFTHLIPKHPGYTLQDLKNFIEALQYFILMYRRLSAARQVISPEKPSDHPST